MRERVVPDWVRRLNHNPCRVSTETTLMQMAYFMGLGRLQGNPKSGHWQPQSSSQVSGVDGGPSGPRKLRFGCRVGKHTHETGIITNERTPV